MKAKTILEHIASRNYVDEDGEIYRAILLHGLSIDEIQFFAKKLPGEKVPEEIKELLLYARGFNFYDLEEISFMGIEAGWFDLLFSNYITLAHDGSGNYWCLLIDEEGNWGAVYYVCHDPYVIVKHSESLGDFLHHVSEYGEKGTLSYLNSIRENRSYEISNKNEGVICRNTAMKMDDVLSEFASRFDEEYYIADLRNKPISLGCNLEKADEIIKHERELLWAFKLKQSWFKRLFG